VHPHLGGHSAARPARLPALLVLLLVGALSLCGATVTSLVAAPQAAAHDELVSSVPKDGGTVDEPPSQITLTFSGDVIEAGTQVLVSTPDGTVEGEIEVAGEVVTAALPGGLPAGDYDVRWRVVSSDGHPIEGELGFGVDAAGAPAEEPEPSPSPTTSAPATDPSDAPSDGESSPGESSEPSPEASAPTAGGHSHATGTPGAELDDAGEAGWAVSWLFGVAVLAAVGIAAAFVLRHRRSLQEDTPDDDRPDHDGPGPDAR